mmetsp:Transcript_37289/g.51498  ORF Transcript_37289/g.51498 Transcript_37289/m.51498 type:complete len:663 (+) Transcript_37289:369-2357(+)|eukprot:CAMPEP_0201499050 /NCGR_PEP_ID=MMETSP0151_2-20130828/74252_1 /ASSEMBLY_ACC=CAM_ASM_000257 /TAXON_ID=200890 /ORGANISM="Paramoeba atlantica, Strain 621/1 / CCAP 1560/9" /LENGTH=662 /DNA_ID=CAMNT_0047891081 /DNA_START=355 /DNA_END=2343 /DNA_ORIENTATION=-
MEKEFQIAGLIGGAFSSVSRALAIASPLFHTPQISALSSAPDLSDSSTYPFFSRIAASDSFQGLLLADLCHYFGWDRVATIATAEPYGINIVKEFSDRAIQYNIAILSSVTIPQTHPDDTPKLEQIRSAVEKTKASGARVILLAMFNVDVRLIIEIAIEMDFFGPPYNLLLSDGMLVDEIPLPWIEENKTELVEAYRKGSVGILGLFPQGIQPSEVSDQWIEAWEVRGLEYPGGWIIESERDTVYTMAFALDRVIRRGGNALNGTAVLNSIQSETNFLGVTGNVILDEHGDRLLPYEIYNVRNVTYEKIGVVDVSGIFFDRKPIFGGGTQRIPDSAEQVYVSWGDPEAIAMLTLYSFGILLTVVSLVIVMRKRTTPIMCYSSPRFMCGVSLGVLIGFSNVFVWSGKPTDSQCEARPWLLMMNFVFVFGHLYVKAFRFLYVMKKRKKLFFKPVRDLPLFLCVFLYSLVFVIPLIVWTTAYPLERTRSDNHPDNDKVNIICDGENSSVFLTLFLTLGSVSLLVGVLVAFLNRNYNDFFSESSYIGYTLYTVCITCCVVLPLLFLVGDRPHPFYIVLMTGIFLSNGAVLLFLFSPKLVVILLMPERNVIPVDASGSLVVKKGTTTTTQTRWSHSSGSEGRLDQSTPFPDSRKFTTLSSGFLDSEI